jgi:hypothetical protein
MARKQTSLIELLETPKEVDRLNRELMALLDEAGTPADNTAHLALSQKMADLISQRIFELHNLQKTIGVELEYVTDMPKIRFFEIEGGCSSC